MDLILLGHTQQLSYEKKSLIVLKKEHIRTCMSKLAVSGNNTNTPLKHTKPHVLLPQYRHTRHDKHPGIHTECCQDFRAPHRNISTIPLLKGSFEKKKKKKKKKKHKYIGK